ncbi:MAG: CBS domain-containing protein [Cyclobacteriaceae bacterium]|jgi:CBS domain-containing protein
MVKSYKGVQVEKSKSADTQSVTVSDYMSTKLITFRSDQHMDEVIKSLLKNRISGGPVVNEDGELIGVISEGDCMKEVVRGKYNNMPNLTGKVSDHMSTNVISISPETNIFDAADKFLMMRIRRFPVVSFGKLIGQISQKDIMRAVHNLKSTTW